MWSYRVKKKSHCRDFPDFKKNQPISETFSDEIISILS